MGKVSVNEMRRGLSDTINRVAYAKERIVLTRRRKGVVAIVPLEDLALIEAMEDRMDVEEARRILADPKERGVPWSKVKKQLGL